MQAQVKSRLYLKVRYFTPYQAMDFFFFFLVFSLMSLYTIILITGFFFGVSFTFAPKESTSPLSRPEKDTGLETEVVSMPNRPATSEPPSGGTTPVGAPRHDLRGPFQTQL